MTFEGTFRRQRPFLNAILTRGALAAFMTQTVPLETHTVKFEIWDTAGTQQRKHRLPCR